MPTELTTILQRFEGPPPDYLFHYGSLSGLMGILNSKSIWASEIQALNDQSEALHACSVLEHALENKFYSIGIKDNDWFHSIALQVRAIPVIAGRCVASFCEQNDELSLWRAYASDGMGACIGLPSNELFVAAEKQDFTARKVIYDQKDQYAICCAFVNDLFEKYRIEGKISRLSEPFTKDLLEFVNSVGIYLKHPSFRDEREWRLISNRLQLYSNKWKYRSTSSMIVPYVELDWTELIKDYQSKEAPDSPQRPPFLITLGPRVRKLPTSQAIQAIAMSILGKGHGASLSSSPYRG